MNSDKTGAKRRTESNISTCPRSSNDEGTITPYQPSTISEESPNYLLYKKVSILLHYLIYQCTL